MHVVVDSPIGPLTLVERNGALAGVYVEDHRARPTDEAAAEPTGVLAEAARQLEEYFAGERTTFDVPLDLGGTDFQRRVWACLQQIPYGETATYGELARELGSPGAARAVGLANGRNPVSILVPCHRVVGSSGKLVGYAGGLNRKQLLLELERAAREPRLGV